jgi:acetyl-CoA carboxylase biotin carboxyl carrier protein
MSIKEIEELIRFVSRFNISEVDLETKDIKLVIKTGKNQNTESVVAAPVAPIIIPATAIPASHNTVKQATEESAAPAVVAKTETKTDESRYVTIKSPMIGTFYRSSGPDKPPFINVNDAIEKGKVICIIEAMKLFNEIEAEISGTLIKVLVNDASPVEYEQPLFLIDPS